MTLRNSLVTGSGTGGVSIFRNYSSSLIENTEISDNGSYSPFSIGGSGAYLGTTRAPVIIRDSTITRNTSTGAGGGILARNLGDRVDIESTFVTDNRAYEGAGIQISYTDGSDRQIGNHRLRLRQHPFTVEYAEVMHVDRVLHSQCGYRGCGVTALGQQGFDIGLQAGTATGVVAGKAEYYRAERSVFHGGEAYH